MSRSNPRVFTEQGVAMLSTILKSKEAIKTSISIMDASFKDLGNKLFVISKIDNKALLVDLLKYINS